MRSEKKVQYKQIAVVLLLLIATIQVVGCGGGGGGSGGTSYINTTSYGDIDGYVYVPIGSGAKVTASVPAGYKPVENASVSVTCGSTSKNSTTNSSGYFKISSLPTGTCSLTIVKSGYTNKQMSISVSKNTTSTIGGSNGINLDTANSGSIRLAANVSGGEIFIDGEDTNILIPTSLSYTFNGVSSGTHRVGIQQSGFDGGDEQIVDVSIGDITELTFIMNPGGNQAPVADAGVDATGFNGYPVNLYAYASSDPDGDTLTYKWEQTQGASVSILDDTDSKTTFIPTSAGLYGFKLTVNDGYLSSEDQYVVNVIQLKGKFVMSFNEAYVAEAPYYIYTFNYDGTDLSKLTSVGWSFGPTWSEDGSEIAFVYNNSDSMYNDYYLHIINSDGTNLTNISGTNSNDSIEDWSPDGTKILYTRGFPNSGLYTMDRDGTNRQLLINTPRSVLSAKYSPDGSEIIASLDYGGINFELFRMNSDGTGLTRLTDDDTDQTQGNFTNDNQHIVYQSSDDLMIMDRNGNNVRKLMPFHMVSRIIIGMEEDVIFTVAIDWGIVHPDPTARHWYVWAVDITGTNAVDLFQISPDYYPHGLDWTPE